MANDRPHSSEREQRLDQALLEYLRAQEAGEADRLRWLEQHQEISAELNEFFRTEDVVQVPLSMLRAAREVHGSLPVGEDPALGNGEWGDFSIEAEIGQGGTAVVYRARQKSLHRLVALKVIRNPQLAGAAAVERFRREAEAVAALDHPGIVPIYEIGEHAGHLFFTMKLFEGGNLASHCRQGPLDSRSAAHLVSAIADAVDHAHQRGILHRDLKPSNILLDAEGRPHVSDFGLAKGLAPEEASLTASGAILGSPSYMSPEQAAPAHGASQTAVTTASDVHGLGAILYALLTGRPPFEGASVLDTLERVRQDTPTFSRGRRSSCVTPLAAAGAVDPDLQTICLKCLEKDPSHRYASAATVAAELRRYVAGEPILARPISRSARAWRWCRRNPLLSSATAVTSLLLMLLLALGIGLTLVEQRRQTHERERDQAEAARDRSEELLRALRRREYATDISRAYQALRQANLHDVQLILARHVPGPDAEDLRGFEWHYLDRLARSTSAPLHTAAAEQGEVYYVAFSPDGTTLTSAGKDGTIRLWDVCGTGFPPVAGERGTGWKPALQPRALLRGHTNEVNCVAFSPDGKTLASASDDQTVRLWDVALGRERARLLQHEQEVAHVAFSPDGRLLASAGDGKNVCLWNASNGTLLKQYSITSDRAECVVFSQDGKTLVAGTRGGWVHWWDVAAGTERLANVGFLKVSALAFSPDGQFLAAAGRQDFSIKLLRASDGAVLGALTGHTADVQHLAFAPDGQTLASCGDDGNVCIWDLATRSLRDLLVGHQGRVWCLAYSPDGKILVSAGADATLRVWSASRRWMYQALGGPAEPVHAIQWSAENHRFLIDRGAGPIQVWDTATRQMLCSIPHPGLDDTRAFLSPTGRVVAVTGSPRVGRSGTVALWDVDEGRVRETWQVDHDSNPWQGFSRDGRRLIAQGPAPAPPNVAPLTFVSSSRSGEIVPIMVSGMLVVRDLAPWFAIQLSTSSEFKLYRIRLNGDQTGGFELVQRLDPRLPFALAPDGLTLAVGDVRNQAIELVDFATGEVRTKLPRQLSAIRSAVFLSDGKTLAIGYHDGQVKLWQAATGVEFFALDAPLGGEPLALRASPDGKVLACVRREPNGSSAHLVLWLAGDGRPPLRWPDEAP